MHMVCRAEHHISLDDGLQFADVAVPFLRAIRIFRASGVILPEILPYLAQNFSRKVRARALMSPRRSRRLGMFRRRMFSR